MGCTGSRLVVGATATISVQPNEIQNSKPSACEVGLTGAVSVKTWIGGADGTLIFPEIEDPDYALPILSTKKAPLAICVSGGGLRSASLALGWLRALHELGILGQAKYLVTVSGSTWTSSALCFQKVAELDEFLGKYLAPEECSLEALGQVGARGRSFAAAVADAAPVGKYWTEQISSLLTRTDETKAGGWTKAIAQAFLEPFNLGSTDESTVTCSGTKGDVHTKIAKRAVEAGRGAAVYEADVQNLPYLIVCQNLVLENNPDGLNLYPFEWTPLYGGCPVAYSNTITKLGCGWVETLGLNAVLEDQAPPPGATTHHLRVRPAGPASLAEAASISSDFNSLSAALVFGGDNPLGPLVSKVVGSASAAHFDMQNWANYRLGMTDGCGTDFHAVYPALRRKVANMIVLSATRDPCNIDLDTFTRNLRDLALLFGAYAEFDQGNQDVQKPKGVSAEQLNKMAQVFPREGFSELHTAMKAKVEAGEPAVHVATYPVLANSFMGITGGWHVRVMWVINDRQAAWEARLPQDTRDKLEADRNGFAEKLVDDINPFNAETFRHFPHLSTYEMDYPPELVGLMAAHAAHMLVANRDAVKQMLEPVVVGQE